MFARKFRLPATVSLPRAQFVSTPFFSLKIAPNNLSYNRYGFVVTKKTSKRAHVRNRTKRRLRACVESLHKKVKQGYDMLFMLRPAAVTAKTQELTEQLHNSFIQKQLFLKNQNTLPVPTGHPSTGGE